MENSPPIMLSEDEKEKLISSLTEELGTLRTKAGLSQEELASLIGVSRQTYGSIERKIRSMTWNMYLSLILFFDYNQKTHDLIRTSGVFPYDIIKQFNNGSSALDIDVNSLFDDSMQPLLEKLDEQALRSIKTLIMVEYARCTETSCEIVIKSFDGRTFNFNKNSNLQAAVALKEIKERRKRR